MNKSDYLIFEMVCSEHFADVDFKTSDITISAKSKDANPQSHYAICTF